MNGPAHGALASTFTATSSMVELADIVADLIAAEHVAAASVILRGLPTSTPFTKNGNDIRSHVRSRVSAKAMLADRGNASIRSIVFGRCRNSSSYKLTDPCSSRCVVAAGATSTAFL
jgi:hypothetical protein